LQNSLNSLDVGTKNLPKARAFLQPIFIYGLQKRINTGKREYEDFVIEPVMKTTNRSVDSDVVKQYYKPFYDSIIAAKTALLEKTYTVTIKAVETFMGSLAAKGILSGCEVIDRYGIQRSD
jgi:hypothetical protein